MAHRNPGSVGWALAARSVALWQRLVAADPAFRAAVEWQVRAVQAVEWQVQGWEVCRQLLAGVGYVCGGVCGGGGGEEGSGCGLVGGLGG